MPGASLGLLMPMVIPLLMPSIPLFDDGICMLDIAASPIACNHDACTFSEARQIPKLCHGMKAAVSVPHTFAPGRHLGLKGVKPLERGLGPMYSRQQLAAVPDTAASEQFPASAWSQCCAMCSVTGDLHHAATPTVPSLSLPAPHKEPTLRYSCVCVEG